MKNVSKCCNASYHVSNVDIIKGLNVCDKCKKYCCLIEIEEKELTKEEILKARTNLQT